MADAHQRLARFVSRDRRRLYRSRREFAEAAGISRRTVEKLEAGTGGAYQESTKARVEAALYWTEGTIDRILAGGRPSYERDALLAELQALWPQLSRDARSMLVRLARDAVGQ